MSEKKMGGSYTFTTDDTSILRPVEVLQESKILITAFAPLPRFQAIQSCWSFKKSFSLSLSFFIFFKFFFY